MPIFSNRTIAQMLQFIGPVVDSEKAADLRNRLAIGQDAAVAAEWEIAIVSCLARQGSIEAIAARKGVRELEVICTCSSENRVAIEVTAVRPILPSTKPGARFHKRVDPDPNQACASQAWHDALQNWREGR